MMAKRDLNAGEELFLDYDLNESVKHDSGISQFPSDIDMADRQVAYTTCL